MPQANIIAANGGLGKGDHRSAMVDEVDWKQKVKSSFLIRGNPLRPGGRTRHATSPYYGEAALRASPIERAYKNRTVHYGQAVLFPPGKGKGDHEVMDEVDLSFCKTNLHFANGETS